jgi:2OG-Fe(II) oxygenase superfamily
MRPDPKPWPESLRLEELVPSTLIDTGKVLHRQCSTSEPFPHVIIDNLFHREVALDLAAAISGLQDRDYRVSFRSLAQRKLQLGNIRGVIASIYPVYQALMGPIFTNFAEIVSGYSGLQADPQFAGAGLHRYHRNGFTEIHLDSNRHPFDAGLHHRVNLIIFLNLAWQTGWGGELVLWSSRNGRPDRPVANIEPAFNRAVIFSVNHKSWHSVKRIKCPRDRTRDSMAIYFFNRDGCEDDERPRSVLWHSTRGPLHQAVFEVTNRVITLAKPHARYLRWLRGNKFDGIRGL